MAGTLGLVLAANAVFVGLVVGLCAPWVGPAASGLLERVGLGAVAGGWWLAVGVALFGAALFAQARYVRRETLGAVDARRVTSDEYPALHRRLTRLATGAGLATPDLYVVESSTPNSFALDGAGKPVVAVSEGLLVTLDDEQLDAVLAHELAHLKNRDATVMTLASFLPALTSDRYTPFAGSDAALPRRVVVAGALVALYLTGAVATGSSVVDPGYAASFLGGVGVAVVVGGVALGVFATLTALAARRLSRYREFAADRGAARLTGDPTALAGALDALTDDGTATPETDKRTAYRDLHGLCLLPQAFGPAPAATTDGGTTPIESGTDGAFHVETRAHPPTDERVARLQALVDS